MLPLSVKGLPSSEIAAAVMNLEASLTRSFFTARSPAGSVAVSVSGVETASVPAFRSSLIRGDSGVFMSGRQHTTPAGSFRSAAWEPIWASSPRLAKPPG